MQNEGTLAEGYIACHKGFCRTLTMDAGFVSSARYGFFTWHPAAQFLWRRWW